MIADDDDQDLASTKIGDANSSSVALLEHAPLPFYLSEIFSDLYQEDGLAVLGRGLGLLQLMACFCRFYIQPPEDVDKQQGQDQEQGQRQEQSSTRLQSTTTTTMTKPMRVFVLGLRDQERQALISILESWGTYPNLLPTIITNESGQSQERIHLYSRGGIFIITSRILIVDLLSGVIDASSIDGFLVAHAESISEQSTESFILRLFRTHRKWSSVIDDATIKGMNTDDTTTATTPNKNLGFIKAFTDAPDGLLAGFAKVDKVLKALFVRRLYLYPRNHETIAEELETINPPKVEGVSIPLTPCMKEMQNAIAACVQACIRELKKSTVMIDWSNLDLTVENCVTKNLDQIITRQLEHDWHRLSPKTKQLVSDLKVLRSLFQYLLQYDCISFWRLITSIKTMSASARQPSLWILSQAGELLYQRAKERMYSIHRPSSAGGLAQINVVLEECPKWKTLQQLLSEIRVQWKERLKQSKDPSKPVLDHERQNAGPKILVMVRDERTLDSLRSYLTQGPERTKILRWLRYLEQVNDRSRSMTKSTEGMLDLISDESRLLLEEESKARYFLFGNHDDVDDMDVNAMGEKEKDDMDHPQKKRRKEVLSSRRVNWLREWIVVRTYSSIEGEQAHLFLHDMRPSIVIMYDIDLSFTRALELYSTCSSSSSQDNVYLKDEDLLRVYFMVYEASSEEMSYLKSIEREKNAFDRLIEHKKTMCAPTFTLDSTTTQIMQLVGDSAISTYADGTLPLSLDSRTHRGGKNAIKHDRRDIAVDVREFRSALPSILHQGGMRLAPVTLIVGDFVLTNIHCVERKSISDLFGSFASGRLYTQCEAMQKYYKIPCLLIEFDPLKSFSLQSVNDLGAEIRNDNICSKMAVLAMHFPKLRILWSRSPYETLKLFKALKADHEEVDVNAAASKGCEENNLITEETIENEDARELLLRLPGVNSNNARKIMSQCNSIAELAEMSRDELKALLGPLTGQKLFTFFRQRLIE